VEELIPGKWWALVRARRVPGADHHEGQGGSQRRGTRWNVRYRALCATGNVDLDSPLWARRLALRVFRSATAANGTRLSTETRVSPPSGTQRVVFDPTLVRLLSGLRFTPNEGSPRVARRLSTAPPLSIAVHWCVGPHGRRAGPAGQRSRWDPVGGVRAAGP